MKLFGFHLSRHAAPVQKSFASSVLAFLRGDDAADGSGAMLTNAFVQSTWVFACVTAIARQIANTPFTLAQGCGQGEVKLKSGPLTQLFTRPHPQFTHFEFWELIVCWLLLRGEVFLVPLDAQGAVVNLEHAGGRGARVIDQFALLDPAGFRHLVSDGQLLGWRYTSTGREAMLHTMDLLPGEVIHHRLPNPFSIWRGLAPLSVAALPAQADYAASQFHKGLMLNNADTGVIVTTEQQLDDQQREQIMASLKERKRKAGTADRPLFLWGGAKVDKPALSSADMEFLENRKFSRQEICAIYGVPQEVIGFSEDANRSVGESARCNFIEHTCVPHAQRLQASLAPVLRAFGPDLHGYFDFDCLPIMQAARLKRVSTGTALFAMSVPFNDINRVLDLGFPDYAWGNQGYLPFSLQAVHASGAPVSDPASSKHQRAGEESAPSAGAAGSLRAALAALERGIYAASGPTDLGTLKQPEGRAPHVCAASAEYAASIAGSVRSKLGKLGKFFLGQRGRVLAKLEQVRKHLGVPGRWLSASAIGNGQSSLLSRAVSDVFDAEAENELLLAALKPALITDLEFGGAQVWQELGLGEFPLAPDLAADFLRVRGPRLAEINHDTFIALSGALAEGAQSGESFAQLADRVRSVFNEAAGARATVIALMETNCAVNSGRFAGLRQGGVTHKVWRTAEGETARPTHQQAGVAYSEGLPLDEPFVLGEPGHEERLRFPGDPQASTEQSSHCRCHVAGVANAPGGNAPGSALLTWEEFQTRTGSRAESPSGDSPGWSRAPRGGGPGLRCSSSPP